MEREKAGGKEEEEGGEGDRGMEEVSWL